MQGPEITTFLFTDIEGSTRLWEQEPERMPAALARHDALARSAVEAYGGQVVKMTGDGLHAAFGDPLDAIRATARLQAALADPAATEGIQLPLRSGLHTGPYEQRDNDFYGIAVNRAARIMGAAHGGQILVSQAVAENLADRLEAPLELRDLGLVRLRDLSTVERLYQVLAPGLRSEFPALRSLEATPNNLPLALSSFVGRGRELGEIQQLMATHRLVTLVGMGGVGKTRLSLHVAAESLEKYRDGVWLVELGALHETERMAQAVASTLGVREEAGRPVDAALTRHLKDRQLLLIFDNCEHVLHAAAAAARQILAKSRGVRILATSREALRLAGEMTYLVPGLGVPGPREALAMVPEAIMQFDSVRLFDDRARAASPDFGLTSENATLIAAICNRLDGIPLAIELAAARVRSLSLDEIAARLKDRFRLLTSGDPTALPRQRTLRAMIDWSHELLPADEQALFRRLAVFAGGWTLEAAEQVCGFGGGNVPQVLDLLSRLVEKSLVATEEGARRYRMLETVREYALERLAAAKDVDTTGDRHLDFFVRFTADAKPQLAGPAQGEWLARIDAERENILAAHEWAGRRLGLAADGLRLVNAIKLYWTSRGLLHLGLRVTLEALQRPGAEAPNPDRAQGLFNAGQIRCFMGRYAEARQCLGESLAIARQLGDPYVAAVLQPLGMAAVGERDFELARRCFDESVQLSQSRGDRRGLAGGLNSLAMLHRVQGQRERARPLYEQVVRLSREMGNDEAVATGLLNLAMVSVDLGFAAEAHIMVADAIRIAVNIRSAPAGQSALDVCAGLASQRADWVAAAWFLGAADAQAWRSGLRRDAADAMFLEPKVARARAKLTEEAFRAAEREGGKCDLFPALAEAQSWLRSGPAAAPAEPEGATASR